MKKLVVMLMFFPLILGGCGSSAQGNVSELTGSAWSAELDGGGEIELDFDGDEALLLLKNGDDSAEIAGKVLIDDESMVIFDTDARCNYRFDYAPRGELLSLTYEGNTVELKKSEKTE